MTDSITLLQEELSNRIVSLYLDKYTQKEICEQLLVSTTGIKKNLARKGVERRSYSENNRRYYVNEHYFDIIDTQNKAYILGLLYADGNNHTPHNAITLSLQECDRDVLEFVKNELEYAGAIRVNELSKKNSKHKDQYVLCINNEYLSQRLFQLGVVDAKSLKLTFPAWLSADLIPHFIRGYFDGDGCIYYDKKENRYTTCTVGTRDFCKSLSDILYGFGCANSTYHPAICNENTVVLRTGGNRSTYSFLSWIYKDANFYMKRKHQKYIELADKYSLKAIA